MDDKQYQQQSNEGREPEKFESDTEKLVHRHMSDPNHEFTDEELQNVKVGMSPGPDAPTQEAIENAEKHVADRKSINEDDTLSGGQKITPWDLTS